MKTIRHRTSWRVTYKKAISLLLSLLMIIGVMTFSFPIAVSADVTVDYKREGTQDFMTIDGGDTWHNIYIFNGEQILPNVSAQANTITDFSTVDGEDGAKWFRALKNAPAYNACFRVGVGAIPYANFEEFAVQFKSTCKVTKAVAYEKGVRLDFRKVSSWSTVVKYYSSTNKHLYTPDAQVHEGLSVVDVTTTEISNAFSTDNVPNLVLFPWRSDTNAALTGECTFDIKWLGVFSQDGMAAQFDYDDYADAIAEKITVTFQDKDGEQIGEPTELKVTAGMTFNDFVEANAFAKSHEWCEDNKNGTATVFAGWKDVSSDTVYTKTSPITTDVTVKATYTTDAIIITASDLNAGQTNGKLVDVKNAFAFEFKNEGAVPLFRFNSVATGSHNFSYMLFDTATSLASRPYVVIKGSNYMVDHETKQDSRRFKTFVRYTTAADGTSSNANVALTASTGSGELTKFTNVFDLTGKAGNDAALGINIAPWSGQSVGSSSYMDIEYIAILSDKNAAKYINIAAMNSSTVTLNNEIFATTATNVGDLLKQAAKSEKFDIQKKVGEEYKIVTSGITVNGSAANFDAEIKQGDIISTVDAVYSNVYVYTPEQLATVAAFKQAQGEVKDGYFRVTTTNAVGAESTSDIRVFFRITDDVNVPNGFTSLGLHHLNDFTIPDAPYYSLVYNTNIVASIVSNNVYVHRYIDANENDAYDEGETAKYDTRFPRETRVLNQDRNYTFDITTDSYVNLVQNNYETDLTGSLAAINIPIYNTDKSVITADDYFDIKYLGFFPNAKAESMFNYDEYREEYVVDVKVKIDGTEQTIAEKQIINTVVALPDIGQTVGGQIIEGYLDGNGNEVTAVIANSQINSYTAVTKNNVDATKYINNTDRGNLANLAEAAEDGEITVAYIGGSVTYGQGAYGNGYVNQTTEYLESKGLKVNAIYAGLGSTGSRLGAYRIQKQVIDKKPDLVFVEYAVNDPYYIEGEGSEYKGLYYEYIFREIRRQLPKTEIVALFSTNAQYAQKGGMYSFGCTASAQEKIAKHYGAASINTGGYIVEMMFGDRKLEILTNEDDRNSPDWTKPDSLTWIKYFGEDIVHPNAKGYSVYAEIIGKYLDGMFKADPADAQAYTLPETTLYGADWFDAKIIDLSTVTQTGFTYTTLSSVYENGLIPDGVGPYSITFPMGGDAKQLTLRMSSAPTVGDYTLSLTIKDGETTVYDDLKDADLRTIGGYRTHQFILDDEDIAALQLDPEKTYTAELTFSNIKTASNGRYRTIDAIMLGGKKDAYEIKVTASEGGTVYNGSEYVSEYSVKIPQGDSVALELEAKPETDHKLRNWYDITKGNNVIISGAEDGAASKNITYTVTPKSNIHINANFMPTNTPIPARLIAFVGPEGNGKISVGDTQEYYLEDYVSVSEPPTLTAIANEGYYAAYWIRFTSSGNVAVLMSVGDKIKAYPLGGDVFYQPVFAEAGAKVTLYADDSTKEILGNGDTEPAAPSKPGYEFVKYTDGDTVGDVTVKYTEYKKLDSNNPKLQVYGANSEQPITSKSNPAYGDGFKISATSTVANPVWTMISLGGQNTSYVLGVGETLDFHYMFAPGTEIVIKESDDSSYDTSQAQIHTLSTWNETDKGGTEDDTADDIYYTRFSGAFLLPAGANLVDHGIMMSQSSVKLDGLTAQGQDIDVPAGVIVGRINQKYDENDNPIPSTPVYAVAKKLDAPTEKWYGRAYLIYELNGTYTTVFGATIPNA